MTDSAGIDCFCLTIEVSERSSERVMLALIDLGHTAFEERSRAQGVALLVYAAERTELESLRARLEQRVSGLGFELAAVDPSWAVAWTEHLDPVQLTPALRVVPSAVPAEGRLPGTLHLEPAFAFGFGEHASTRLAASWLEQRCTARPGASVLDVGTGTGILALVAASSGAGRVLGVDTSQPALAAARHNALQNGLATRCTFVDASLAEITDTFDLVVANIEAGVLHRLAPLIAPRLSWGAELALAGFIAEQVAGVIERFAACGITLELSAAENDWQLCSGQRT
ncbi:MAG: 50S ribosomal protein L11 methyltransferase [Polyangiaceae bacterium]